MKHLKRFNELNVAGTYLDKKSIPSTKKNTSEFLQKNGKIFKDEPTNTSEPILKFEPTGVSGMKKSYKVIFPKNFMGMDTSGNEKVRELLVDKVFIVSEGKFNRIHFEKFQFDVKSSSGVPEEFRGTGLGYLIYDNFIKYLGFASSNSTDVSDLAKNVWNKIAGDPDFHGILIRVGDDLELTLVFHKSCKDIERIVLEFAAQHVDSYTLEVRIDDELMKLPAVAEMKQRFDEIEGRTSGEGLYRDKMVLPEESPEEYSKFFPKIKQKRQR